MSTRAELHWTDGERFVVSASSGHAQVLDADRQRNSAPGPMELVLMALCGCTATDVVVVLRKKRQAFTSIAVTAEGERATEPPTVYTSIQVTYRVDGPDLDPEAVRRAVELSETRYCSVAAMLRATARIRYEIHVNGAKLENRAEDRSESQPVASQV
jgi:putative redox protein